MINITVVVLLAGAIVGNYNNGNGRIHIKALTR